MAPRKTTVVPVEGDEDSEWEYEYHETETEDFYITLDLSSHARQFAQGIKRSTNNDADPKTKPQPSTGSLPTDAPIPSETPPLQESGNAQVDATPSSCQAHLSTQAPDPEKQKRIQITDIHTLNPLISYNSQLYSCDWTTIIGTDMLFTTNTPPTDPIEAAPSAPQASPALSPSPRPAPHPSSLRTKLPTASLIGTTRIKLSAHPVQVFARSTTETLSLDPAIEEEEIAGGTDPQAQLIPSETAAASAPLIALPPTASLDRQNQAAFLSRLIEIKRAKGETDEVLVHSGSRDLQRGRGGEGGGDQEGGNIGIDEGEQVEDVEMLNV